MIKLERIHFLSNAEMLSPLRSFIRELANQHAWCKENMNDILMAVNEACMNIIQHAYKKGDEEIVIEFWKDKQEIVIKIFDFSDCVEIENIKSRDLSDVRPGGLGVHFIYQSMDSVEYKNNSSKIGNVLSMRKKLNFN